MTSKPCEKDTIEDYKKVFSSIDFDGKGYLDI